MDPEPTLEFKPDADLDEVIETYLKAAHAGAAPSREELIARYPGLAKQLADFFAAQQQFQRFAEPVREALTGIPAVGTTIRYFGDYELLEEIARGGMGVVYRARQVSLNRVVALKMILAGQFASPEDVQRFHREAEAAANLDHPHIVPIYEVGEHDGQHYFSMKLIEGHSLANGMMPLPARSAAELLASVARAVHHAHQRGILHRDLKPGNILIGPAGEPYVADFGLAKHVEGERLNTRTGAVVGTPSYMPPEQARSDKALTTAADVYSLGAVFYEMLLGRPPFRGETPLDTVLQVLEREPEKPRSLNRRIDPDLETICLKCLNKEPAKRYGSAEGLADDLDRWLKDEPIVARAIGHHERLWRWCRRKPLVASLSAALSVVLVAGFLAMAMLYAHARRQQGLAEENEKTALANANRADTSYRLARAALDEQMKLKDHPLLQQGALEEIRKQLLHNQARFFQEFLEVRGDDPEFLLDRAQALFNLAKVDWELGLNAEAVKLARQAEPLLRDILSQDPQNLDRQNDLAAALQLQAVCDTSIGRLDDADAPCAEATTLFERLAFEDPEKAVYRSNLSNCYNALGILAIHRQRYQDAAVMMRKTLDIRAQLTREDSSSPEHASMEADAHVNLGMVQTNLLQLPEAESSYAEAKRLLERLSKQYPNAPSYQKSLAHVANQLGLLYQQTHRPREAELELRKALELREYLAQQHPFSAECQDELCRTQRSLAWFHGELGRLPEAETGCRKALELCQQLVKKHPEESEYVVRLAQMQCALGNLACGLKPGASNFSLNMIKLLSGGVRQAEAVDWYTKAIETLSGLLDRQSGNNIARQTLMNAYWGRGTSRAGEIGESDFVAIVEDYDRAIALSKSDEERRGLEKASAPMRRFAEAPAARVRYAARMAQEGNHAKAALEVETAIKNKSSWLFSADLGNAALVLARCAAAVQKDNSISSAERKQRFDRYAARAVDLRMQDQGGSLTNKLGRAEHWYDLAGYLRDQDQMDASLAFYAQTLSLLGEILAEQPKHLEGKQLCCNALQGRAEALDKLRRHTEADPDWEKLLSLALESNRPALRMARALSRARAGFMNPATSEADDLAKNADGAALYNAACVYSLCAAAAKDDAKLRDLHAGRSLVLLRRAQAAGFFKPRAEIDLLKKDRDLAALRDRAEFNDFVTGLQKAPPDKTGKSPAGASK
jgi:serine/threonine-protein kinase